jgi:hypothetical protein
MRRDGLHRGRADDVGCYVRIPPNVLSTHASRVALVTLGAGDSRSLLPRDENLRSAREGWMDDTLNHQSQSGRLVDGE